MNRLFLKLSLLIVIVNSLFGAEFYYSDNKTKILKVPHYYEYDANENLGFDDNNGEPYYWCGHAALKMALEGQGVYKTLIDLHYDFKEANKGLGGYDDKKSLICHTGYCAFPALMKKTVNKYNIDGYDVFYRRNTVVGHSNFISTVKKEIDKGNIIVALSAKFYDYNNAWKNVGHYFTIIGYQIRNDRTILILRDPYLKNSNGWYDVIFYSNYFWNYTSGQNNYNEMVLSIIGK